MTNFYCHKLYVYIYVLQMTEVCVTENVRQH